MIEIVEAETEVEFENQSVAFALAGEALAVAAEADAEAVDGAAFDPAQLGEVEASEAEYVGVEAAEGGGVVVRVAALLPEAGEVPDPLGVNVEVTLGAGGPESEPYIGAAPAP